MHFSQLFFDLFCYESEVLSDILAPGKGCCGDKLSACRKKRRPAEPYAIASGTGCEETRTTCQIIYGPSSEMRISVTRSSPPGAQVNVEWDNQVSWVTIRESRVRDGEQILSLRVVSTNRR
jgi:hypothetical protein